MVRDSINWVKEVLHFRPDKSIDSFFPQTVRELFVRKKSVYDTEEQ